MELFGKNQIELLKLNTIIQINNTWNIKQLLGCQNVKNLESDLSKAQNANKIKVIKM